MSPLAERLPLDDAEPSPALVERAAQALAAGSLVVLPTESGYRVAARADLPAAVAALADLRPPGDDPWTWHVGERSTALDRAAPEFPRLAPLARRLADRYWPGPLTLLLEGAPGDLAEVSRDGYLAVRLPAHRGTAGILAGLEFPVVTARANADADTPPIRDADAALAAVGDRAALIFDGGPARLNEPPGLLRLGRGRFELLREGLVNLADLRAVAGLRIGFCCTGNTCRSPMAEGLAKLALARRLGLADDALDRLAEFGFEVRSMGAHAGFGMPASEHSVRVLADEGYDLSGHQSTPATPEGVAELDRVYCLTPSHRQALVALLPPGRAEHVELLDPEGRGIPDPIGGPIEVYRACMEAIRDSIARRADEWA